jgi:pSer/pThr/pTyr-binding forkhead associated (FHA) protein
VIIECSSCHAKYQYDEARFDGRPSKKIKCAKCQSVFEIHNPNAAEAKEATHIGRPKRTEEPAAPAPAPDDEQRSTGKTPAAMALPAGKRLSLAIIDGPDAGNVFRIEKPRVTVGRAGADLTLNDSEASRQHAAVEVRETVYLLHDLGSTNGTLVSGARIEEATELQNHSEFQVGATTLMLIVTDET